LMMFTSEAAGLRGDILGLLQPAQHGQEAIMVQACLAILPGCVITATTYFGPLNGAQLSWDVVLCLFLPVAL